MGPLSTLTTKRAIRMRRTSWRSVVWFERSTQLSGAFTRSFDLPTSTTRTGAQAVQKSFTARSLNDFKAAPLRLDLESLVDPGARERYAELPDTVSIRDKEMEIGYEVEEGNGERRGVARLRLPEKVARTLTEAELPQLDRPLYFMVMRGQRGAVRANSLQELQDALDQPWTQDEVERAGRGVRESSRDRDRSGGRGKGKRGGARGANKRGGPKRDGSRQGGNRGDKRGAPKSRGGGSGGSGGSGGGRGRSPRGRR